MYDLLIKFGKGRQDFFSLRNTRAREFVVFVRFRDADENFISASLIILFVATISILQTISQS